MLFIFLQEYYFCIGLLEGGALAEVELKVGKLTTDKEFYDKCSVDCVYLDYVNITKVVKVNNRIFVDDRLISLIAKEIGE